MEGNAFQNAHIHKLAKGKGCLKEARRDMVREAHVISGWNNTAGFHEVMRVTILDALSPLMIMHQGSSVWQLAGGGGKTIRFSLRR